MVSGARLEAEAPQIIPVRIRKTIQSIREIVGNHSDADIYATLKENNMDPNESTQKLLNQDPFHEVKRKRDKRKEFTGYELPADPRKDTESNHWEKSNNSMHLNARRGGFTRYFVPDARVNKEFRVVKDNRVNQIPRKDAKLDSVQRSRGKEHLKAHIFEKRSAIVLNDQKLSDSSILDGFGLSQDMKVARSQGLDHEKDFSRSRASPPEDIATTPQSSKSEPERAVLINSAINSSSASTSSVIGVYSTSDPVHVPSPDSRSAITVGTIRREVGAVGARKQSSDGQSTNSAVSNNSRPVSLGGEIISASSDSPRYPDTNIRSSQVNQVPISVTVIPTTTNRRFAGMQNNSKHLQSNNHQRAMPPNMEWKPKVQKLKTESPCAIEASSALPSSNENELSSNLVDATDLSNKFSHVNIHGEQNVIIPQHLRVPEAESIKLTFGSFGDGSESSNEFLSPQQSIESAEQSEVTLVSNSASVPVGPNEETSAEVGYVDYQAGTSRSVSPASAEDLERPPSQNNEALNPQNIESYADIGLVRSHSPPYSSQQPQRLHEIPSIPNFSPYGTEASYVTPFFQTSLEDNARGNCLASPAEILNLHAANINSLTTTTITQQQQQQQASQQQQQAMAQIYPQIHFPHYPNFMPYRHIISPLYGPPMAMPNYSSNPAYAHPSAGSSYVLMPGGTSHLPNGGIKYPPSQYKPLPTGSPTAYGNYSSPAAFAIGTPSPIGGPTGLEDMTRIKFKDNNLYVPNQQAEASDMWMQNPRELTGLQTPYYNLSGHGAHPTAFVSAQAAAAAASGHTSFNAAAAQPSPMQYPGMYHAPQPSPIAAPHHLVHQQVPPSVGMAAGGQVGGFQQTQLGRLNWTANF